MKLTSLLITLVILTLSSGCTPFVVSDENMLLQSKLTDFPREYPNDKIKYTAPFPNKASEKHPFFRKVEVGQIKNVPNVIRNINIAIASSENYSEALSQTLSDSNLLAQQGMKAEFSLQVEYISSPFPYDNTPGWFSEMSISDTTIRYKLTDKKTNNLMLDRAIKTTAVVRGLNGAGGYQRAQVATRTSHILNIASIVWCLENFDGYAFPSNCSLGIAKEKNKL